MLETTALKTSHFPADTSAQIIEMSLGELLRTVAAEVPARTAVVVGAADPANRVRLTYAELLEAAETTAKALAAEFQPGSRVAIWSPNRLEFEVFQLGASLAGLTVVMVNPALKKNEAAYVLMQSRSVGLFYDDTHLDGSLDRIVGALSETLPDLRSVHKFSDWPTFVGQADPYRELPEVDPHSPAQIQYTSGTTGFPKGALLRHSALITNAELCNVRSGVDIGGVFINPLPMFHVGSCTLSVIGAIVRRGTHVMIPRFDPALALELIESERGTIMVMVPTVMHMMLEHPDLKTRDLSSLRTIFSGGANVPESVVRRAKEGFGAHFTNGFGQTEAHGTAIQTSGEDSPEDQATTVGRPLPLTEVKIADLLTGHPVPIGQPGEICLRGYQTMTEYFDKPQETAEALDPEGWLHTGDIGSMDERGYVRISARLKDMIIRGGENVYPAEVENVLVEHPAISQIQVFGVSDEKWGDQVAAAVKFNEGARVDFPALYAYGRERMASFKVPRVWAEIDDFPTTASGKIQKFSIRDRLEAGGVEVWRAG